MSVPCECVAWVCGVNTMVHVWRSEDNAGELVFSLHLGSKGIELSLPDLWNDLTFLTSALSSLSNLSGYYLSQNIQEYLVLISTL